MLHSINSLFGYELIGKDGTLGTVFDVLIDDSNWSTRYLLIDTGVWLPGKKLIIEPKVLQEPNTDSQTIPIKLDRSSVTKEIETLHGFDSYSWWEPSVHHSTATRTAPALAMLGPTAEPIVRENEKDTDISTLHSLKTLIGQGVSVDKNRMGSVEDFILCTDDWKLPFLIATTRTWLPQKRVMVATTVIKRVVPLTRTIQLSLSKQAFESCPEYKPKTPINRRLEEVYYDYEGHQATPPE